MRNSIILMAVLFLFGCKTTEQGAIRKVAKVSYHQPQVLAKYCADKYPILVYDSTRIEYRKGETITKRDTVTVRDTVTNTLTKYIYNTVVDTFYRDVNKQSESTAKTDVYKMENDALKKENAILSNTVKSKDKLLWWFGIIGGIALLGWIVWLIVKFFK